ncbi:hypothetical protein CFIMG_006214RA [Ceratocystis fimbriata CBS 114723]|uniref:Uncharacterized protein n=1 Tax=Ceratocystis fimbriata CBS 114723 TaxID=1035309 RepID=A0A2C5WMH7_9PEZI|nr:hypothetical protein CFIMG_006214RA [Ceratocystis fimbriata CBS 114723]
MKLITSFSYFLLILAPAIQSARVSGRRGFGVAFLQHELAVLQPRDGSSCLADQHNCGEINQPELCCGASQYCFIQTDSSVGCCSETNACISDICKSSGYLCTTTTTSSGTITTQRACCPRLCPTGSFLCPSASGVGSDGSGCCAYGFTCQGTGGCVGPAVPTITGTSATPNITPVNCATDQRPCANGPGGCCPASADCSVSSNGDVSCVITLSDGPTSLASSSISSSTSSPSASPSSSSLSGGAKAGLAIGVIAATGMLSFVGYVLWQKHRDRRAHFSEGAMSEIEQDDTTVSANRPQNIYTGPNASVGPWTYTGPDAGVGLLRTTNARGVAGNPQHPGEIMEPVEIGSESPR